MPKEPSPGAGSLDEVGFGPLRIRFDTRLLRPREWTTAQSRWAAALLEEVPDGPVLELCAGAGHIGLLAVLGTTRDLVSVDLSPLSARWTQANAEAAGLRGRVETRTGPMDEVLGEHERFPLVVADPPWVPAAMVDAYPEDPVLAIDGGEDGMDVVRTTLQVVEAHLADAGAAVLQLGTLEQARSTARLLAGSALHVAETRPKERGVLVLLRRAG